MQTLHSNATATHTFNRAADDMISRANAISHGRAGEYSDSWSLENLQTPWLDNLLRSHTNPPEFLQRQFKRLVIMASMLDIKLSRLAGPWKDDTAIDSINYLAAYAGLRNEFEDMCAKARAVKETSYAASNSLGGGPLSSYRESVAHSGAGLRT